MATTIKVVHIQTLGLTDYNSVRIGVEIQSDVDVESGEDVETAIAYLQDTAAQAVKDRARPFLPFVQLSYVNADHSVDPKVEKLFMGKPVETDCDDEDVVDSEASYYQG